LAQTAWEFFENSRQLAPTAARLHVHVNTVRQRLDRMDRLHGGPGWRSGPNAVDTHFALRLWKTRQELSG
ncbi:MAG: helix-turn-helix domain-containing protein, partial [Propionibacteriaceae bacterium]|jgi:DNA-binding PucR family transcriptional regulator|nr:helix-turn-helix domain-containing protein [Propionibacteriaceae bacterium]